MIFKTYPATKRDIANLLELNRGSINHVIKHIIKCRVKKKPKVHQHTQATVEKRRERSWRLYLILNARKLRNYVITDFALFYLCGNYGKIRVYYVWQGQPQEYNMKSAKREECAPWIMVGAGVSAHGKTSLDYRYEGVGDFGYLYSKRSGAFCEKICTALDSRII